jgi:hypothetical protein
MGLASCLAAAGQTWIRRNDYGLIGATLVTGADDGVKIGILLKNLVNMRRFFSIEKEGEEGGGERVQEIDGVVADHSFALEKGAEK